jgi:hypothetical protein
VTGPSILLPKTGRFPGEVITECEWRLRTFVERDAYAGYDWAGSYARPPADILHDIHVFTMNSAMRARSSRKAWAHFIGKPLPELEAVPYSLDLLDSPDSLVEMGLAALGRLTERMTAVKGLSEMAVSKVLYLLRPNFVAIADSYVRDALGVWRGQPADTMVRVARAVREFGTANGGVLAHLHHYANSLPPVVPNSGRQHGQSIPVRLSKVRILDILICTEGALFGPTPHAQWSKWYADYQSRQKI